MSVTGAIRVPPSNGDPLTLDMIDYFALSSSDRDRLKDWLRSIVGDEWTLTHTVRLGEGFVDLARYVYDDDDDEGRVKVVDGEPVSEERRVPLRRPPPVWKPLR